MDLSRILYYLTLFIIFAVVLWQLVYFSFDAQSIRSRHVALRDKFKDDNIQALLNGSAINNIPTLRIAKTGNNDVDNANRCANGPVQVSQAVDFATTSYCQNFCASSRAKAFAIDEAQTGDSEENVLYGNKMLNVGSYCTLGPRPECNLKKSLAVLTLNSITCRSKFPNIIGGPLGNNVVACNNSKIYDPKNKLWDYVQNEEFDPLRTRMTSEDETYLENGVRKFRFRCKFDGYDERGNKYQANPTNRFHPIENYCAKKIYRAHPNVRTEFVMRSTDNTSYKMDRMPESLGAYPSQRDLALTEPYDYSCECGDKTVTRVQNMIPGDKHSQCASVAFIDKKLTKNKYRKTVVYDCFNLYSSLADVTKFFPCSEENFLREGNQFDSIELDYTYAEDDPIEHPLYDKFSTDGLEHTSEGFRIEI